MVGDVAPWRGVFNVYGRGGRGVLKDTEQKSNPSGLPLKRSLCLIVDTQVPRKVGYANGHANDMKEVLPVS